jgi:chloramphenicol-sensitive protein RarD
MFILHERLSRLQQLALLFAVLGVINEAVHLGSLPWISLVLAFASGLYGLLRKQLAMGPTSGLFLETLIVLPFALAWLVWLELHGGGHFAREPWPVDLLLFMSGVATALPLLLFAVAARSLPLTTIGFLQYLTPSISFLLAVFVFQETLSPNSTLTFAAIWFSLTIYSADILKRRNKYTT